MPDAYVMKVCLNNIIKNKSVVSRLRFDGFCIVRFGLILILLSAAFSPSVIAQATDANATQTSFERYIQSFRPLTLPYNGKFWETAKEDKLIAPELVLRFIPDKPITDCEDSEAMLCEYLTLTDANNGGFSYGYLALKAPNLFAVTVNKQDMFHAAFLLTYNGNGDLIAALPLEWEYSGATFTYARISSLSANHKIVCKDTEKESDNAFNAVSTYILEKDGLFQPSE